MLPIRRGPESSGAPADRVRPAMDLNVETARAYPDFNARFWGFGQRLQFVDGIAGKVAVGELVVDYSAHRCIGSPCAGVEEIQGVRSFAGLLVPDFVSWARSAPRKPGGDRPRDAAP